MPILAHLLSVITSVVVLLMVIVAPTSAAGRDVFAIRLGSGFLWAPQDKEDLYGKKLYRQSYPFFAEFTYGRAIQGIVGLNHVFSQEAEHVEMDSEDEQIYFTPKLRQYIVHFGLLVHRPFIDRIRAYGGLGAGLVWRAYNPGWKDQNYWDKVRPCMLFQVGLNVKLGPKTWAGAGWRSYGVGWRPETRWTRGEFNRMRRMNVLSFMVSYSP